MGKVSTYWVYILECADGTYYTGISTDVERRFEEHQKGIGARYTRAKGVKKLVYSEKVGTRSKAQEREAAIKKLSRVEKQAILQQHKK